MKLEKAGCPRKAQKYSERCLAEYGRAVRAKGLFLR